MKVKALQNADHLSAEELMLTSPMSISKKDFERIREVLAQNLKSISQIIKDSPADELACLNIEFFRID